MTQFKKGYWNLQELEIQEWIDKKTKGFLREDVEEFVRRLKKEIKKGGGVSYKGANLLVTINKLAGFKGDD